MSYTNARLTATTLALAFFTTAVHADPVEWVADPRDPNHFYEVFGSNGITWDNAKSAVVSPINLGHIGLRGYLATLTSSDEDSFVDGLRQTATTGMAPVLTRGQVWIGGSQADNQASPGDGWQWENGEGAIPGTDSVTPYANWGNNAAASDVEPNDFFSEAEDNEENHLTLGFFGLGNGWNDEGNLGNIGGYIVEYEIVIEAVDDPSSGEINASSGVLKKIDVLANDWVPAGVASVEIVAGSFSDGGSACVAGQASTPCESDTVPNRVGYTSLTSFEGTETFEYKVTDVNGAFAIATVTVEVSATESILDEGDQLIFNQAINPVPGGNNPLTAAYTQVIDGGAVTITCCAVTDWREYAGGGGKKFGNYLPDELDLGYEISQDPRCADMPQQFKNPGVAVLRPSQRGIPRSLDENMPNTTANLPGNDEHDIGVCGIVALPTARNIVITAEQALNVLGYKLDYSRPEIRFRPFTVGVSIDPVEVDFPYPIPISILTDESQSGKRFSDNLIALNIWQDVLQNDVQPTLSRYASALKESIELVDAQNCGLNDFGFADDLLTLVQSAKKENHSKKGDPDKAIEILNNATRLALGLPTDPAGNPSLPPTDPYAFCQENPQGLFVYRLMAWKFATCSWQKHPDSSASTLQGACEIEEDIRCALPELPGFDDFPDDCSIYPSPAW
ncbi:MAG: hypothetical protein HKN35_00040 [Woeseia sp.]|nr:hypothetical protein [Woeseia sp.]NNE59269.1 hypothetical protein [Woeseia sp.]